MNKNILKIVNNLKIATTNKKNQFEINLNSAGLEFIKFLKKKSIIQNYCLNSENTWTIYLCNNKTTGLLKKTKILLLKNKNSKISLEKVKSFNDGTFVLHIISTPYGLMDQFDVQRYGIGGISVCKIYLI